MAIQQEKNIAKRFTKLEKELEEKKRELEIEAALERVRARTMGMHSSSELSVVIKEVTDQIQLLGFDFDTSNIGSQYDKKGFYLWNSVPGEDVLAGVYVTKAKVKLIDWFYKGMRSVNKVRSIVLNKKDTNAFFKYYLALDSTKQIPTGRKKFLYSTSSISLLTEFRKDFTLSILNYRGVKYSKEESQILKRFANVFEQAYTRFLDLQKAEGQAREAQIEAALEKIRSRSLAMHSSAELREVIAVTFEKLNELKVLHGTVGIQLFDWEKMNSFLWVGNNIQEPQMVNLPYDKKMISDDSLVKDEWEAMKEGVDIVNKVYSFKQKNQFFNYIFLHNDFIQIPKAARELLLQMKNHVVCLFTEKNSALFVDSFNGELFSTNDQKVIKRTAKVFEQAYIRFLDLQKAEAQVREAQIEAGLERVRSRAMAMQTSEELNELIGTVFTELTKLDLVLTRCVIWVFDPVTNSPRWWMANSEEPFNPMNFLINYHEHPAFLTFLQEWKKQNVKFVYDLKGQDKKSWDKILFNETELKNLPDVVKNGMQAPERVLLSCSFNNFGGINVASLEPLSDEHFDILLRFAKVFDLTYTRFNDLKQAEAQAREAEIELALERVRAKTMAMQKPSEFVDVANEIGEQLVHLGFDIEWVNFSASGLNVSKGIDIWNFAVLPGGQHLSSRLFIPYFKHPVFTQAAKELDEYIKTGKDFFTTTLNKKDKDSWLDQMYTQTFFKDVPEELKIIQYAKPGYTTSNIGLKDTWLSIGKFDTKTFTDDQHAILRRFGKAFGLAYTRFQDLQKAEAQAREAQIEAALERVRARTMGMHHSKELHDVIETVTNQLLVLGLEFNSANFCTINKDKSWELWLSTPQQAYPSIIHVPYLDHGMFNTPYADIDFFTDVHDQKEAQIFFHHFFENTDARNASIERKQYVYNSKGFSRSGFLAKDIWVVVSRYDIVPFTDEENAIIKRFTKVFEQSYTRFLDLQKAELQAREAQIETALERVRSRTMAMHQTSELQEVIHTVHKELLNLNLSIDGGSFVVINDDVDPELSCWGSGGTANTSEEILVPHFNMPFCINLVKGIKKGPGFFTEEFSQKEKKKYFTKLFEHKPWSDLSNEQKNETLSSKGGYTRSVAVSKHTSIFIINHHGRKFSEAENDILRRFAKVFEQTYTRFLDLQKAEGQSKESQIQLALERVRARTMAMQKSNELQEVVNSVYEHLNELEVRMDGAAICTFIEGTKDYNVWIGDYQEPLRIKFNEFTRVQRDYNDAIEKREELFTNTYSGEIKKEYIQFLLEQTVLGINIPEEQKQLLLASAFFTTSLACTKNTVFQLYRYTEKSFSKEENDILKRFANVFEQSYTRFLDLQKAEAQAREGQIQLALERVRARTMAMQKSDELKSAATLLFQQVKALGVPAYSCGYNIWEKDEKVFTSWMSTQDGTDINAVYNIPLTGDANFIRFAESRQKNEQFFVLELRDERMQQHYAYLKTIPAFKAYFDYTVSVGYDLPKAQIHHIANFSHGNLLFITLEPCPEFHDVFKRFADVFDQTYTRFLDLQKAEEQARESQIQLALERVRARTMAMQKSDELPETSHILYEQMKELGEPVEQLTIGVVQEENKVIEISATLHGDILKKIYRHSIDEPFMMRKIYHAWKTHQKTLIVELKGDELNAYNKYRNELTKSEMFPTNLGDEHRRIVYAAFFSKGMLALGANEPRPPESLQLLERFAGVFDQAYIRFIDLKNAEKQARESQIQLALERVRARTMAMQKSEELPETSLLLFQQMKEFGETVVQNSIGIIKEEEGFVELSTTIHGHHEPKTLHVPINDPHVMAKAVAAWKAKRKSLTLEFRGQELKDYNELRNSFLETKVNFPEDNWVVNLVFFSKGWLSFSSNHEISKESFQLLERFAGVFDLTYTRFLDLKQAEEQARESQIQLALERVRARTMAMQKSEELQETAYILFQQFKELGEDPVQITIGIFNEEERKIEFSITGLDDSGSKIDQSYKMDIDEPILMSGIYKAWKEQRTSTVFELSGKELSDWITYRNKLGGLPQSATPINYESRRYVCAGFFSKGFISFSKSGSIPGETIVILERFASVFDLTYTRFLDLKKAEGQAREAQIETALERVRAVAMAMRKPEELMQISKVIYDQLQHLEFENLRNVQIAIDDDEKNTYNGVEYSEHYQNRFKQVPYDSSPLFAEIAKEIKRSHTAFYQKEISGQEFENWRNWRTNIQDREDSNIHPGLAAATSMCFYLHSVGTGMLGISTFKPITNEQLGILKRFKNVFELSYRRYIDIEKAEMQAREAQIELALERVRARTMAMHRSEELAETAQVLFRQLNELNVAPDRIAIGIADEINNVVNFWSTDQAGSHISNSFRGRLDERTVMSKGFKAWKDHQRSLVVDLQGDDLKEWIQFAKEEMKIPVKEEFIKGRRVHNFAFFSHGWILVTTHEPQSAETIQTLERFASVFSLTYRRFLDLEKAEAQVREAQIEAALEKVRSRSLAMHKSDELQEVVNTVFERLQELNVEMDSCNIAIFTEDKRDFEFWIASPAQKKTASFKIAGDWNFQIIQDLVAARESGKDFFSKCFSFEEKNKWFQFAFKNTDFKNIPPERQKYILETKAYALSIAFSKHTGVQVNTYSGNLPSEKEKEILKRFAKVFEQAYIRFLDLEKAEAQAREAQIEAALERVRAKAMAMHKTEDLNPAVAVVFEELEKLNIGVLRCGISILNKEKRTGDIWVTSTNEKGSVVQVSGDEAFDIHPLLQGAFDAWLRQEDFSYMLEGEDLSRYYNAVKQANILLPESQRGSSKTSFNRQYCYTAVYQAGGLFAFRNEEFSDEGKKVMKRFANVFDLTYKRFLDLQKAEANAREAQIEAGLERVRSRTMAMYKSDELAETAVVLFKQMIGLGIATNRLYIAIINDDSGDLDFWITDEDGEKVSSRYVVNIHKNISIKKMYEGWMSKKKTISIDMQGKELEAWLTYWKEDFHVPFKPGTTLNRRVQNIAYFSKGFIAITSPDEQPVSTINLLERFAAVFNLTYTRFSDLQQAEAQAREAQIEAGLERVRARTMAMHSSDDVSVATATMFTELEKLGIQNLRGGITIIRPDQTQEVWSVTNLPDGRVIRAIGVFDMRLHPLWQALYEGKQRKDDYQYYWMTGEDKQDYINILNATPNYLAQPIKDFPDIHVQSYFFGEGAVWTNSLQPHSEEDKQIMKRFASVFSLTFRRYQDLKTAEAQAKEATIEAALEKVRGKAMAMHNSNDLSVTASMVITELRKLGITPIRCGVGIISKETHKAQLYTARMSAEGDSLSVVGWVMLKGHPVLEGIYEKFVVAEDYFPELIGESLQSYYKQLLDGLSVPLPDFKDEQKHYGHFFSVSVGCLYAWSDIKYNDDEIKILRRFASIIDLTFRRYFELQKSEANAKEAIKQAALDRIRADIASMRTVNDLDRITPLIWNELTILGIPFIRCGVFIMDDAQQLIHTFLSTPDGKAIAAFHMPYDTPGNLGLVISNWKAKKKYIDHWDEKEFHQFADILVQQGALDSAENYLKTIPKGGFDLHFLPFLQGMLYVGNTSQLNKEQIELIQHVADAFSTAYARYEDFNRLEAAKQQVENMLTDLKQAQQQLVQSEKMASLGELTAGIAHEIQNPLNFVNNFSDVSNELLEEMKNELEKGNKDDAIAIVEDVKQNLEKILHHGKRADAIVKGMLQHSRIGSGQKELTDINSLADEYLRLAFHGLRAKDKTFNAKFETQFDDNIGKVNIIPQDIGRVILNLINNAFYTVTEKKKINQNGYEPTVTVTTQKDNGKIEIKVKDNGNGIPQKILDKIFQPFFTTKPTGQGTGLGLSLAYDIITKGHGGELKVETKEGEGSEFVIQLPG